MRELRTAVDIDAPPQRVWDVLVDIGSQSSWNPIIAEMAGQAVEGERLVIRTGLPGGRIFSFRPIVIRVVECELLHWRGAVFSHLFGRGDHIIELSPLRSGAATRLVHREEFRGVLVPLLWRQMAEKVTRAFNMMNAAVKQRAEADDQLSVSSG